MNTNKQYDIYCLWNGTRIGYITELTADYTLGDFTFTTSTPIYPHHTLVCGLLRRNRRVSISKLEFIFFSKPKVKLRSKGRGTLEVRLENTQKKDDGTYYFEGRILKGELV